MTIIEREIEGAKQQKSKEDTAKAIANLILSPERVAQDDVKITISDRKGYEVRAQQNPMDLYYNKKCLGEGEIGKWRYRAGDRFFREFYTAGITPSMTINYSRVYSNDKKEFLPAHDKQREALDNWRLAYMSVTGEVGKFLAVNVCCYGFYLRDLDIANYRRGQDALPRFLEVLDDLKKHYFD